MTRDEMTDRLVDNTIAQVLRDQQYGDGSLLDAIIRGGAGWTQYANMTDAQIVLEYQEQFRDEI